MDTHTVKHKCLRAAADHRATAFMQSWGMGDAPDAAGPSTHSCSLATLRQMHRWPTPPTGLPGPCKQQTRVDCPSYLTCLTAFYVFSPPFLPITLLLPVLLEPPSTKSNKQYESQIIYGSFPEAFPNWPNSPWMIWVSFSLSISEKSPPEGREK